MEELAEFEAQAARDLNNNLFFQVRLANVTGNVCSAVFTELLEPAPAPLLRCAQNAQRSTHACAVSAPCVFLCLTSLARCRLSP